ncbi:C6 domain-containing protein [Meloidogyne graminicola]|uniref:C6 domain-containing protein n=1 Tax=Meloidogyne graminicola TaxID=189291 RepID=A0A8S9ZYK1_9BILA|nr:C6 domain-containing protein [Meloidogyne graminicola]
METFSFIFFLQKIIIIIILMLNNYVNSCMTAIVPPPMPACAACSINQLMLTPGNGMTTTTPIPSGIVTDPNGCIHIMVTCMAINGGTVFMQFNINQGGPSNPTNPMITATLNCIDGQWVFQQGGISQIINEINCQNA